MDGHRTPTRRAPERFDLAAAVSLARQALDAGDGARALDALRLLLRDLDAIAATAGQAFAFDRELCADMMLRPGKYRGDAVAMQAALVRGQLGADSPMTQPPLAGHGRQLPDEE